MSDGIDGIRRLVPLLRELRTRINANKPADDQIKIEQIDAVLANGHYDVQGSELPTTGSTPLRAGQKVAVAHVRGKRVAIFSHEEAKAKFPVTPLAISDAILEELFVGTNAEGLRDVFYRTREQVTGLGLHSTIPAEESIVDIKFTDAYPQTGDTLAKPDVRTLFLVRTSSGAFTEDPASPGTRVEKIYVFRLIGKVAAIAQKSKISKVELVRMESTAGMSLKLLDWTFEFVEMQPPVRLNRWRHDSNFIGPHEQDRSNTFTSLGSEDAALSSNISHAHRTITMAQAIPGFISTFFEEFVQAHIRDVWLDPQTGHTLAFLTLEIGSPTFPAFDPAVGDTSSGFHRTITNNEAGTISGEILTSNTFGPGINVAPEAHAMIVDMTGGVVLWTTMGDSVVRTFTHTIDVTGYTSLSGHLANYQDGVFVSSQLFGTPPNDEEIASDPIAFQDVQSGDRTVSAFRADGFPDNALFNRDEMYVTVNSSTTTRASRSGPTGNSGPSFGPGISQKLYLELTVTRSTKSKQKIGRIVDFRLLRWAQANNDRRLWLVLLSGPIIGFSERMVRPAIVSGAGIVLGGQAYRRLFVQPTGTGAFQAGFLRLLSTSQQHVMFRALLGVSDGSNAPRDSITLTTVDPGAAVDVITFPLTESQSPSSTGTVTWTTVDGSFSQVEVQLPFFHEHLLRLVRRDFALATVDRIAAPPVPARVPFFVTAWDLATENPTLNALSASYPVEDKGMAQFKVMKKIPASVVPAGDPLLGEIVTPLTLAFGGLIVDTNSIRLYSSDWRVINDKVVLKGRWKGK